MGENTAGLERDVRLSAGSARGRMREQRPQWRSKGRVRAARQWWSCKEGGEKGMWAMGAVFVVWSLVLAWVRA